MSVEDVNKEVLEYLVGLIRFQSDLDGADVESALKLSLSAFNSYPPCTYFSLADVEFCKYFADILVLYALYVLHGSDAQMCFWERRIEKIKNSYSFADEWLEKEEKEVPVPGEITSDGW